MEVARLRSFLQRHRLVALDTCLFIYQWEGNVRYSSLTDDIFLWIERSRSKAITSTLTMAELLVHPYRTRDQSHVNELIGLFYTFPNLSWIAPDLAIASRAAEIRAQHNLRTPDAIQAATAIHAKATLFITNDTVFERVEGFETLVLDRVMRV